MTAVMIWPKAYEPGRFSYGNDLTIVEEALEVFNSTRSRMRGYNWPPGAFSCIKGGCGIRMRHVDYHAKRIHSIDHGMAELGKAS